MASNVGSGSAGGLLKSNVSSFDNPLAHPNTPAYYNNSQQYQQTSNYQQQPSQSNGGILKSNASSSDNPLSYSNYQEPASNYYDSNQWSNSGGQAANSYPPLESYKKISSESRQPSQPSANYQQQNSYQEAQDQYQQQSPTRRDTTDLRYDVDSMNKQAYKRALDQQVAEKEVLKYNQEKARVRSEIDIIKQYPFGRRTDPASYIDESKNNYSQVLGYQPSFSNGNGINEMPMKYNKDNIVEKPNSLMADIPPYDPIKHRTGNHQGYNYDPWGKPGGGAPLVDANTGRKFTKFTGQVWYDSIGLSPDDRAKTYADKNRPLTLEEQRYEVELEKQRKRYDDASYKTRAGDVATWITDLESQRVNKHGAHLQHTNVTREKINLEYARKNNVNDATKIYHDELGLQLEERLRQNKLYKLKDDVAGIEHTRKWDDWWGKPGGGAPNSDVRRRDLKGTLESPRENGSSLEQVYPGTSLPVGSSYPRQSNEQEAAALLFAKGTGKSNHKNLYDNQQPMKL